MEPIELDEELLVRIERIGGDSRVETLLGQLTPEQSDAVRARVLEEEDYAEIAAAAALLGERRAPARAAAACAVLRRIHEEEAS